MKKVLVTGGCGYIGSHTIVDLINHGFEPISVDNNINSDLSALDGIQKITGKSIKNYTIDLCDTHKTMQLFEEHSDIIGVIHFAALKSVGESVLQPLRYFDNNINSLLNVLKAIKQFAIPNFIFSSSCSVYGNTTELPVQEDTPFQEAECPYARTKQMGEQILRDFSKVNTEYNTVLLRYFNPAGAHESALIGESPINAATNLVPVITEVAIGKREKLMIHGTDYNTRDGSCVRDYIHVMDLANAHTKALQYLINHQNEKNCEVFNLGIGEGVSVLEAVHAFEKANQMKLNYEFGARRPGDMEAVFANKNSANQRLGWEPIRNIENIMKTAWEWELYKSKKFKAV